MRNFFTSLHFKNIQTLTDIILEKISTTNNKLQCENSASVIPRMRETFHAFHTGRGIIKLQSDSSFKPRRSLLQLFRHSEAPQRSKQVSWQLWYLHLCSFQSHVLKQEDGVSCSVFSLRAVFSSRAVRVLFKQPIPQESGPTVWTSGWLALAKLSFSSQVQPGRRRYFLLAAFTWSDSYAQVCGLLWQGYVYIKAERNRTKKQNNRS